MEQSLACSPIKWGSGGAGAWNESASLALEVLPRLTPGAFLVSFCAHKKKLAARRNLAPKSRDGFSHRFFWRCQKKWGRERSFPKAQPLDAPSQSTYRRAALPRREGPMQGLRPCPLDKPHAFAYTVRVKRLGREGVRASPDTERRRLVQGVSVRARKVVPEPHP